MKKKKQGKILYLINIISMIISTFFMLRSFLLLHGVETKIRILLSFNFLLILFFFFYLLKRVLHKKGFKKSFFYGWIFYVLVLFFFSFFIHKTYYTLEKVSSDTLIYSSSFISLKENKATSISNIEDKTIGYLKDLNSYEGNVIPLEVIKEHNLKNQVKSFDTYEELIDALYEKKVSYIFLPSNYSIMFSNLYETIKEDTKEIYKSTKEVKAKIKKTKKLEEPFTILIMGVDSEDVNIKTSTFNGDALMLITFNPKTLSATILSIPRDSYVPIACFQGKAKNKITHATWYGSECMTKTIEEFLDIKIDYFLKMNFKGMVTLIDEIGGIELEVPYSFCEQDSNRKWGKHTIYVKKGLQTINGEQALALARNRKKNTSHCSSKWTEGVRSDFVRGQNQQLVLRATLNKVKNVSSVSFVSSILNTIKNSMETNMKTSEILSLYNISKDILSSSNLPLDEVITFQRLYLNGEDAYIYDAKVGKNLYNYVLYDASILKVSQAMKVNLGLEEATLKKEFTFDIEENYEEEVIGKKEIDSATYQTLDNYVGKKEEDAVASLKQLGIMVSVEYIDSGNYVDGIVIKQSVSSNTDISTIPSIILTVFKK